jgi:hypothetical protein
MRSVEDTRRCSDRDRVIGNICQDNRIGADHGSSADSDSRADDDVLTQPGSVADLDRAHSRDALLQHGARPIVERVHVIGDVDVAGEQDFPSQPHRPDTGENAAAGDARPVPDRHDHVVDRLVEDLKPGSRTDEDIAPDCDATLA